MKHPLAEVLKMDLIKKGFEGLWKYYILHESKFLTGGAVGFQLIGVGMTYKYSPIIHQIIDNARYAITVIKESDDTEEEKKAKSKTIYVQTIKDLLPYISKIVLFVGASSYCAIKNEKNHSENVAKLTAALALAQGTINEYSLFRKEAEEELGKEKVESIDKHVTETVVKENPPKEAENQFVSEEAIPMFDPYSNTIFYATWDRINYACECMSNDLLGSDETDLSKYHDIIGISPTDLDAGIVWHSYKDGCKIHPRKTLFEYMGQPCYKVTLYPMPKGFGAD